MSDIDYANLQEWQIVNHFDGNPALTSKFGLCRTLRSIIFSEKCDMDVFYPRCYDLADTGDFEDFIENYKLTKSQSILKEYLLFH